MSDWSKRREVEQAWTRLNMNTALVDSIDVRKLDAAMEKAYDLVRDCRSYEGGDYSKALLAIQEVHELARLIRTKRHFWDLVQCGCLLLLTVVGLAIVGASMP